MKKKKLGLIICFIVFIAGLITITVLYNGKNDNQKVLETEAVDVGIIRVNNDNYESEVLNTDKVVVLDFYENMCPPCTSMIPTLINIAKSGEDVKVVMINMSASDTNNLSKEYEVSATPTIVILKDGKQIEKFVGATSEKTIMSVVNKEVGNTNE